MTGADWRRQEAVQAMPILIFILFIVGLITFSFVKASLSAKPDGMVPEELELNSVRDALIEKQDWSLERAEAARSEYFRFLTLLHRSPGFMVIPSPNEQCQ